MAATILIAATVFFFPAAMALAASMDVVTMTIPNRVCAALAIGYFVLAVAVGLPRKRSSSTCPAAPRCWR